MNTLKGVNRSIGLLSFFLVLVLTTSSTAHSTQKKCAIWHDDHYTDPDGAVTSYYSAKMHENSKHADRTQGIHPYGINVEFLQIANTRNTLYAHKTLAAILEEAGLSQFGTQSYVGPMPELDQGTQIYVHDALDSRPMIGSPENAVNHFDKMIRKAVMEGKQCTVASGGYWSIVARWMKDVENDTAEFEARKLLIHQGVKAFIGFDLTSNGANRVHDQEGGHEYLMSVVAAPYSNSDTGTNIPGTPVMMPGIPGYVLAYSNWNVPPWGAGLGWTGEHFSFGSIVRELMRIYDPNWWILDMNMGIVNSMHFSEVQNGETYWKDINGIPRFPLLITKKGNFDVNTGNFTHDVNGKDYLLVPNENLTHADLDLLRSDLEEIFHAPFPDETHFNRDSAYNIAHFDQNTNGFVDMIPNNNSKTYSQTLNANYSGATTLTIQGQSDLTFGSVRGDGYYLIQSAKLMNTNTRIGFVFDRPERNESSQTYINVMARKRLDPNGSGQNLIEVVSFNHVPGSWASHLTTINGDESFEFLVRRKQEGIYQVYINGSLEWTIDRRSISRKEGFISLRVGGTEAHASFDGVMIQKNPFSLSNHTSGALSFGIIDPNFNDLITNLQSGQHYFRIDDFPVSADLFYSTVLPVMASQNRLEITSFGPSHYSWRIKPLQNPTPNDVLKRGDRVEVYFNDIASDVEHIAR